MSRPLLLAILVVVVLAGAFAARQLVGTDRKPGGSATDDRPAETPPTDAERARRERLQKRLDELMPRPEERERPGPTPPKLPALAPEQVRVTLSRGGDVLYAGETYRLGTQDPDAAAQAAADLRAALMKAHEARGGDDFREADGRSKLVLLVRSGGDLDPSALHRLLEAVKQPPLRATRVEFDLGAR